MSTIPHSGNQETEIRIFLDLDGVIADFKTHITTQNKLKPDGEIDWYALDYQWWATMPAFKGARAFYDKLRTWAPVKFLTKPVLNEGCFSGKAAWIKSFVPERGRWALEDLIILPGDTKHLLARPDRILIDDRENNIETWREAGGIGILHTGDFQKTLSKLQTIIADLRKDITPSSSPSLPAPG